MANKTTGGNQITPAYTTPANGAPLDADVVKNNFNNTRTIYNAHDSSQPLHVQSGDLVDRPAPSADGRFWVSKSTVGSVSPANVAIFAFDNGSAWLRDTTFSTTNGQPGIYSAGSSGASLTIDWNNGPIQQVTLTDNCTFSFNNAIAGSTYTLILTQDGTGGRSVTLTGWDFGDNAPSYNTGIGKKNVVSGLYDGTEYLGAFAVKGA